MKKKINNYRFQQQQQAKIRYQKVKKVKETIKEKPEDVTEELDYIKKLLNGEDVGNFGPEEPVEEDNFYWTPAGPMTGQQLQSHYKSISELLSIGTIKQIKQRK
jgi:hypothetical protein